MSPEAYLETQQDEAAGGPPCLQGRDAHGSPATGGGGWAAW